MIDIPIPEANSIGYGNFFRNVLSLIFSNHRTNEKLRPGLPPRGSGPEGMFLGNLFVVDQDARQSESIKRVFYRWRPNDFLNLSVTQCEKAISLGYGLNSGIWSPC